MMMEATNGCSSHYGLGQKYVWKEDGKGLSDRLVEGMVKLGGVNLMMWGCMT